MSCRTEEEDELRAKTVQLQSWLTDGNYRMSSDDYVTASQLLSDGYLPEDVMTTLATRIQSSWSRTYYYPSVAEVQCAAVIAATGHLTSVKHMHLANLELPIREDIPKLARIVSHSVNLETVTGNISPLLLSLNCTELSICDMELDQAATSSLVRVCSTG